MKKVYSIQLELLKKSRESALSAVQIYNNPLISFKSEIFIVLMIIAWTYLLHSYYKKEKIEYRYFKQNGTRKRFDKTKHGAFKYWELERCLSTRESPIDSKTSENLRFLIGLRHEIEHQMTKKLDDTISARFQSCCLNYNTYLKKLFGEKYSIDKHLSLSLQFSNINMEQKTLLEEYKDLPKNIQGYITKFDTSLSEDIRNHPQYAYRVIFTPKNVNHIGQADKVIEFIPANSPLSKEINAQYVVMKDVDREKFLPQQIVDMMNAEGFSQFTMHHHTQLWKSIGAKKNGKGYGLYVAGKNWYWYKKWVDYVREHCRKTYSA